MHISTEGFEFQPQQYDQPERSDPRADMSIRLPNVVQPFLTWLTAKPAIGEVPKTRSPILYVVSALILVVGGCVLSTFLMRLAPEIGPVSYLFVAVGLVATTSGLGLFQVGIFHHCAHSTVFRTPRHNRTVGRMISAILLFKYFDSYKHEHMLHHNPNILFTMEDEFSDFVVNICDLSSGIDRKVLWRRLVIMLLSPEFHARFMYRRICGSLKSSNPKHNIFGIAVWAAIFLGFLLTHSLPEFVVAVALPVSVLLQIATVFRILCEHRVPEIEVIDGRGQSLICQATAAVFPGRPVPASGLPRARAMRAWTLWWANMLTVQLFVRVVVLVGDAPCHDFHHRRPARKWTGYIHARQADLDAGCPGFPLNYVETWGLFRAVDENFAALARAPAGLLTTPAVGHPIKSTAQAGATGGQRNHHAGAVSQLAFNA